MSRIYFHTPSGEAELRGSERAWLSYLALGPAETAWGITRIASYDRAVEIMAMVPEAQEHDYGLHDALRKAQEEDQRNGATWNALAPGQRFPSHTSYEAQHQFVRNLQTALHAGSIDLEVAGHRLRSADVDRNTALVAGSDPVRLAAKIDGWCEAHCWVEGPDRAWMAGIIDDGLRLGLFRRGIWCADGPNLPKDRWSPQGWEGVLALLRARDDEPVVLSYSVCDPFPNEAFGADWETAMPALREEQPWAQLAPDTLAEVYFGSPVTVYDLLAPDRDERVRGAFSEVTDV